MRAGQAIQKRIFDICAKESITINKLATITGVSRSSIKNILYGKSLNPKIETIMLLCDGLGMTYSAFFDSDIFHNLELGESE